MNKTARTFKVLSLLLTYPEQELINDINTLHAVLTDEAMLPKKTLKSLKTLMHWMAAKDLFEVQEHYVEVFDRGRSFSLHLFEHVHGDSRERGQAMVDLSNMYLKHGMRLDAAELPDYLPLFLEFLSTIPIKEARQLLADPIDIIEALAQRLKRHDSLYHAVLDAVVYLASARPNLTMIRRLLTKETQESLIGEELDKQWTEQPVTFMGENCPTGCSTGSCSQHSNPGK